jgi:hypothetical protein
LPVNVLIHSYVCRAAVRAKSLKLIVGPLAVVNMAPDEFYNSSARSYAIGPLAHVSAHEFKCLAAECPASAAAATDVSVSVSNVLPGVAIRAGAFKAGLPKPEPEHSYIRNVTKS